MNRQDTQSTQDQVSQELAALRAAFEAIEQAVFVIDARDQQIVDANATACQALGLARAELVGRSWAATGERLSRTTLRRVDVNGDRFVVLAQESVSNRAQGREPARDALTGLASREALLERINWDSQREPAGQTAVLFIDLDRFKQVNDTCGHVVGDRVLRVVAERLAGCIRPSDLLVRYGGDEFVVVADEVRRRRDLQRLAQRILSAVRVPIIVNQHEFTISASVGIAQRSATLTTIEDLITEADRAMYRAKVRDAVGRELPVSGPMGRQEAARIGSG